MRILGTPFAAVFWNEVRLNARRIAPYVMILLCAGNGLLWWGWGPGLNRGWAVNADFFISGALPVYSFMTLPLFTAVLMADCVIRDFRAEIDPLIFCKPISRAQYLLGKFFGNFFVLVCGQSAFVVMWFLLQAVPKKGVTTLPRVVVIPYIKHFLVFVVISHLTLAAFYFVVGALTRNTKIVYGLGVAFYPVLIVYNIAFLNNLPFHWNRLLDPLLMRWGTVWDKKGDAAVRNQLVIHYDLDLYINRFVMLAIAALLLTFLYRRFIAAEKVTNVEKFDWVRLNAPASGYFYDPDSLVFEDENRSAIRALPIPKVSRLNDGVANHLKKLASALSLEFKLLFSERSLLVVLSIAVFLSLLEVSFWAVRADPSYSAGYASNTARSMLLFIIGIPIFYIGEAIHRERDLRIESLLRSQPVASSILLSAKFLSTLSLMLGLILSVGFIAIVLQLLKGNFPFELSAYLNVYGLISIPNAIFLTAFALALHVLVRSRVLAYALVIGIGAGLYYFYMQGHNDPSYNPLLLNLWTYQDLVFEPTRTRILNQRAYVLALSGFLIIVAHLINSRIANHSLR
jgi:ABC-type transport system involved in multi-copper enzyme maturation permease subunit